MTVLKWLLVIAAAGYVVLLAAMYVFQRTLMYFPDTRRASPAAAGLPQAEEVTLISADGEKLVAWYAAPRGDSPVILYFQGNAGGLDLRADRFRSLVEAGNGLLALCYRGYGGSTGKPSEAGLILDAKAVYDFAAARFPAKRIVPFGESLGTGVAVALAAERSVGGLILDAPYTSIAEVGASVYWYAPARLLIEDSFRSDERIARVTAPLLVLHGEQDRIVPIKYGERLFSLAHEPKRFMRYPNGGHVNLDEFGAKDAVRQFLDGIKN